MPLLAILAVAFAVLYVALYLGMFVFEVASPVWLLHGVSFLLAATVAHYLSRKQRKLALVIYLVAGGAVAGVTGMNTTMARCYAISLLCMAMYGLFGLSMPGRQQVDPGTQKAGAGKAQPTHPTHPAKPAQPTTNCGRCGAANVITPQARFCYNCGGPLNLASTPETPIESTAREPSEPGWRMVENQASGVGMSLPPAWELVTDAGEAFLYVARERAGEGGEGFYRNVNVTAQPVGPSDSLHSLAAGLLAETESSPDTLPPVTRSRVVLALGEAERIGFRMRVGGRSGGEAVVSGTQYLVVVGQRALLFSFGTLDEDAAEAAPVFEKMAETIRIADA
jgi:hypothetical protein